MSKKIYLLQMSEKIFTPNVKKNYLLQMSKKIFAPNV